MTLVAQRFDDGLVYAFICEERHAESATGMAWMYFCHSNLVALKRVGCDFATERRGVGLQRRCLRMRFEHCEAAEVKGVDSRLARTVAASAA
jgi:hypothetical protein